MKSFANPTRPGIEFEINGETYRAKGVVPASLMVKLMNMAGADETSSLTDVRNQMTEILEFITQILEPESAARLKLRLSGEGGEPIDWGLLTGDILPWLVEQISNRPTELPSGSPDGQRPTGESSTGSAPSEESTPQPSPSTGS
jgi:hypothetical protein